MSKNSEVTQLLERLGHPLRLQIESLRELILSVRGDVSENVKWNGPNYQVHGHDLITLRLQPKNCFQIVFHTGAKVTALVNKNILEEDYGLLDWKANDRAILDLKRSADFERLKPQLTQLITLWFANSLKILAPQ